MVAQEPTDEDVETSLLTFAALPFERWNEIPKRAGVYRIIHRATGRKYIGSAVNLYNRARHHRNDLLGGIHHCSRLQRAFLKYGREAFMFEVVEFVDNYALLIPREQHFIDTECPDYNSAKVAGSILGIKRSPETIARLTEHARERARSPAYRAKLSLASKGRKKSAAHRRALSLAVIGMRHSEEAKEKIRAAGTGRRHSAASLAKMSAVQKGRYVSPETCARISASKCGIKPRLSEEVKKQKSDRMKAAWVERRLRNAA